MTLTFDCSLLKQKIPGQDSVDLQHLRRFAKSRFLPAYLQPTPEPSPPASESGGSRPASSNGKLKSRSRSNSGKSRSRSNSNRGRSRSNSQPSIMYLLVCPVSVASRDELCAVLSANPLYSDNTFPLNLREITAPLFAPTTQEQADKWSEQYWPTIYRKSNPFGPHPSIITRAQEEIQADDGVEKALELARKVAEETSEEAKFGVPTGCVVVERANGQRNIIAAAGDARDHQSSQSSCSTSSNPMAHCVMRAIGMVARKRVRAAGIPKSPSTQDGHPLEMATQPSRRAVSANNDLSVSESLLDYPLTATEREHFEKDNLVPNGYLCVDLDVYITHEPCVMCSMAILHSRFGRCVFGKRMPATGALYAENSLGYGLFWRPELNWKFLCWERTDGAQDEDAKLEEVVQV